MTVEVDTGEIVLQALRERRSMPQVESRVPPREVIERVIEAGTWAPNHHRTAPWHFVVLTGGAREQLGTVMADRLRATLPDPESDQAQKALEKERAKPLRAPVVIAVAAIPTTGPKVIEIEEVEATAAAVENMLLAAQALGLGAMWRTGPAAYAPEVKRFLGLPDDAHIVSFVYLGYPALPYVPRAHKDEPDHTSWLGWD